jgi:hypothetical protein
MPINETLTDIIRGRTIEMVSKEEGLVTLLFDDHSTMHVKVIGGPTMNMLGEGRIEFRVRGWNLNSCSLARIDRTAILTLASPGAFITVKNGEGQVEYAR